MKKINVCIVGMGNCACSLIQGINYYKTEKETTGLMHYELRGYKPTDINIVMAIDIDARKVGKDISEAMFAKPNCTKVFCNNIPHYGINVEMGVPLDGISEHMKNYPDDITFVLSDAKVPTKEELVDKIKESGAEMIVNYLPVGSQKAVEFYAECALEAGVGFINCMPVFIASDDTWIKRFADKKLPLIGDDVKSQLGATIVHRELARLFEERGIKLKRTYQLNTGGNTDFLNMLNRDRLKYKSISKTSAVQSNLNLPLESENIHIGPSDFVEWQKDNKVCFLRIEGEQFGGVDINLELRLSVEDSPNSAGIIIDAIRCMKIALDKKIFGNIVEPSAYFMKHPKVQLEDFHARKLLEVFINE